MLSILFLIFGLLAQSSDLLVFDAFFKSNGLEKEQSHLVFNCNIYDLNGALLRAYGGDLCIFEETGDYLIAKTDGTLALKDKNNKTLWLLNNVYLHHTMSKDSEGNYLVMGSRREKIHGAVLRLDVLYKIRAKDGIILKENVIHQEHIDLFKADERRFTGFRFWRTVGVSEEFEISHGNSFYEIKGLKNKELKRKYEGHYIVNVFGPFRRLWIIDKDSLQAIQTHIMPSDHSHDIQMLPDGQIIYINNIPALGYIRGADVDQMKKGDVNSQLETFDFSKNLAPKGYFPQNKIHFSMPFGGSLQLFKDGSVLLADMTNNVAKATFFTKDGETLKEIQIKDPNIQGITSIRLENLNKFMSLNIGI